MTILVGTKNGCLVLLENGSDQAELKDHQVGPLALEADGNCIALVDRHRVMRRMRSGDWTHVAFAADAIQSILPVQNTILLGGDDEALLCRINAAGTVERVRGFDTVPERASWHAVGIPLGVRSLASVNESEVLLAAVHVGGIPRSADGGISWKPTIPVDFDVHEVRAHARTPNLAAAASAAGLCISIDGGENWKLYTEGLAGKTCLAVCIIDDEVLFSVQDGPFARRSQVWRWRIGQERPSQVREGLPEWFEGKVDTCLIVEGSGRVAILDGGGNLWLSEKGSIGWAQRAHSLPQALGLALL